MGHWIEGVAVEAIAAPQRQVLTQSRLSEQPLSGHPLTEPQWFGLMSGELWRSNLGIGSNVAARVRLTLR